MVAKLRALGGEVYAITSEPQRLADDARNDWQLNFETVGDPHHEIANTCRQRDWLDIIVNTKTDLFDRDTNASYSHPKGYFQPGVLALDANGRVLYRWRGVPTRANMGGATERPTANYVFDKITAALESSSDSDAGDAKLDTNPELDSRGIPWPLFVSILTANGWFINVQPFPHDPGGPPIQARVLRALLRIPVFLFAWVMAFILLPKLLVSVALLGWVIWITPKIRYINEQFQNVKLPP